MKSKDCQEHNSFAYEPKNSLHGVLSELSGKQLDGIYIISTVSVQIFTVGIFGTESSRLFNFAPFKKNSGFQLTNRKKTSWKEKQPQAQANYQNDFISIRVFENRSANRNIAF